MTVYESIYRHMTVYASICAYKIFWQNVHDPWIRTVNLMHTARLSRPLDHECWYSDCVYMVHVYCIGFRPARHLLADVGLGKLASRRAVLPPAPPAGHMFASSPSQCHASVLHWNLSYNASASWWGSFTCMLGLVNMRHKFRFVCSPPLIEFTVEILFWNNQTERRAPIRGQALQLANAVALTRRRQKCMRFCFAYGKITGRKSFAKVEVKVFGGQMLWSAV